MRHFIVSVFALVLLTGNAFADTQNCNGSSSCQTEIDEYYESTENHGGEGYGGNATGGAGGSAAAFGGDNEQGQLQGQAQGQVGINSSRNNVETDVDTTDVNTDVNTNKGFNLQGQSSVGKVDSHDSVLVEGDTFEAAAIPVNTAAPVFAGACSQGASLQLGETGASVGSGNPVCDYVAVAGAYIAAGEKARALSVLKDAEKAATWRWRFSMVRSFLTLGLF